MDRNYGGEQGYGQGPPGYAPGPNMGYQQQPQGYAQHHDMVYGQPPQAPAGYEGQPPKRDPAFDPYNGKNPHTFDQAFALPKPKYNDLWAGILFIITSLAAIGLSGWTINKYVKSFAANGRTIYSSIRTSGPNTNAFILLIIMIAAASLLSFIYLTLARMFTKQFIWMTGILNITAGFAYAIYLFYRSSWGAAIITLILSVFTLLFFFFSRKRIPFSKFMLQTSIDVSKKVGHVYLVSILGTIAMVVVGLWYVLTVVSIYASFQPGLADSLCGQDGSCSSATVIGLIVFVSFVSFWMSEWIKNTMHTTISGVYGSWYFLPNQSVAKPTRGAFRRAITYSFGSIALGSAVVAVVKTIRQLISMCRQAAAQDQNILLMAYCCIVDCCFGLVQGMIQFVNSYAFSHIALYGKSYFESAKDVWRLLREHGVDVVMNECLVGPVMSMGAFFIALSCMFLAYIYLWITNPPYNDGGAFTAVILAISFLIGLQVCLVAMAPIESGIETIFVAAAWDPAVLYNLHPELWAQMHKVNPKLAYSRLR